MTPVNLVYSPCGRPVYEIYCACTWGEVLEKSYILHHLSNGLDMSSYTCLGLPPISLSFWISTWYLTGARARARATCNLLLHNSLEAGWSSTPDGLGLTQFSPELSLLRLTYVKFQKIFSYMQGMQELPSQPSPQITWTGPWWRAPIHFSGIPHPFFIILYPGREHLFWIVSSSIWSLLISKLLKKLNYQFGLWNQEDLEIFHKLIS